MNHVALMLYLSKSFNILRVPCVPAQRPREMSLAESSPPYEPSQPATASMSTPYEQRIRFGILVKLSRVCDWSRYVEGLMMMPIDR